MARGGVIAFCALATAGATAILGPVNLVDLLAPHMDRSFSFRRARSHIPCQY
ncbi:iron chelate uptake ABC transporter family permease subunit [Brucella sp.]|uniref:iron chelate uptake ABC transporter family permease subunit n=1 Tax=Brucella TaxID=234 RepID=UPI000DDF405B|nr:iron chelate uptake ABC transporter family permease subunit [Ochrobactrum sp. MYb237]